MVDVGFLYRRFMERLNDICARYNRKMEDIKIVAVSKGVEVERIKQVISCGIRDIGENRVQEAEPKIKEIGRDNIVWHMVGHLQRNKVKKALKLFDVIQSVDRVELAFEINRRATGRVPVLVEVNTSGEPQKYGFKPEEIIGIFEKLLTFDKLDIKGLMTIGPYPVGEKVSRRAFALLRETRDKIEEEYGIRLPILSMGMTEDWEWAVAEGANMLRIGRGLFGERR